MEKKVNMKKNVIWNTVGNIFYCACQWLITVLVVRIDSFEASGYLSLAMTTSSSFSAISLFGMRHFQVSDVNEEYSSREYYGSRIISCVIAQIACMLYAAFVSSSTYIFLCITLFMLVRIAEALADVFHGMNQKFDRYDLIGKSYLLRGMITVVSFSIGLFTTHNLMITLLIMALLNLFAALAFDRICTGKLENIRPIVFAKHVYTLLFTCVPLVVFTFLLSMENLIPKNFLESLFGAEELGIYASIASPTLVVQVMASVIFNPFLPRLTKIYVSGEIVTFRKMFHNVLSALACMSVVVCIGASLVGRLGLKILFGEKILEYYYLFMPIVWCTILTAMIWIISSIVVAIRQIKYLLIGIVVDFAICVAIARPFVERYGKNGVSVVQIVSYALLIVYVIVVCEISIIHEKNKER